MLSQLLFFFISIYMKYLFHLFISSLCVSFNLESHVGSICRGLVFLLFFFFTIYQFFSLKKIIFIFIQLQLSAFSPHPSTPHQPVPPPSPSSTLPLNFVLVSFIVAPVDPSPHYPLLTPLWLLLHCS